MTSATTVKSLVEQFQDPNFWRNLNSSLSIEEDWTADAPTQIPLDQEDLESVLQDLQAEGYLQIDSILPEAEIFRMAIGIDTLREAGLPVAFAFVYDEFWRVFQRLSTLLSAALGEGYLQLPDFWAWYVDTNTTSAGWGSHRDKTINTLLPDGMPMSLTVWIPLTDATPLNGCMSILPAHLDPNYPHNLKKLEIPNYQDIRALPAAAGSVLAWNQAVMHWGGRSSTKAPFPRISIACEFQRGDVRPFNQPLRSPHQLPPFQQRLALIGKQIQQYKHMYRLPEQLAEISAELQTMLIVE